MLVSAGRVRRHSPSDFFPFYTLVGFGFVSVLVFVEKIFGVERFARPVDSAFTCSSAVCVSVCVCARARALVCVGVCVSVCVSVCVCVLVV